MIRNSLTAKIFLLIVPIILILSIIGGLLLHFFVSDQVTKIFMKSLVEEAETIELVLQHAFMTNDSEMLQQTIFDASLHSKPNVIRLLNREGVVLASSIPAEIGVQLDYSSDYCRECHTTDGTSLTINKSLSSEDLDEEVIVTADRVENRVTCQGCHESDLNSLGIILTETPAGTLSNWISLLNFGLITGTALFGILISGAVYALFMQRVARPLRDLTRGDEHLSSYEGKDEIGRVVVRLEQLEKSVEVREKLAAEQRKNLDALFSIYQYLGDFPTIEKLFDNVLNLVREVTGFKSVAMRLYDPQKRCFRLMSNTGMSPAMIAALNCIPEDSGFHAEIVEMKWPVCTPDLSSDPRLRSSAVLEEGYRSLACVPFLGADTVVGSMELATKEEHPWTQDEVRWLALIGRRVGLLIHQIQLNERLRYLATLEERSRIAQEIHDGLAQLLGSLRIWSEEAKISLKSNDLAAVSNSVEKIEAASRDAYASLREEMLGLRDTVAPGQDISSVIIEYLSRFQRQWGIRARFSKEDDRPIEIPPDAEIQLLRIVQEGLTNARRHANASSIQVKLTRLDGWLQLNIADNGDGFDLDQVSDEKLGLRIMGERAASVGGRISIIPKKGEGTVLEIVIPLQG